MEMSHGAMIMADLGTGATAKARHFGDMRPLGVLWYVWPHAERRNRIAPDAHHVLSKGRRDVHGPAIVRHHALRLRDQRGTTQNVVLSGGVVDPSSHGAHYCAGRCTVLIAAHDHDRPVDELGQFDQAVYRKTLGGMCAADRERRVPLAVFFGQDGQRHFTFRWNEKVQALAVVLHPEVLHGAHVTIHDMQAWHAVTFEVHQEPLLHVQLGEAVRGDTEGTLYPCRAQVVVQVDHLVEAFSLQLWDQLAEVIAQLVNLAHMRVEPHEVGENTLGRHMDLGILRVLLQASQHRTREHDVADGREAEDEDLHGRGQK